MRQPSQRAVAADAFPGGRQRRGWLGRLPPSAGFDDEIVDAGLVLRQQIGDCLSLGDKSAKSRALSICAAARRHRGLTSLA